MDRTPSSCDKYGTSWVPFECEMKLKARLLWRSRKGSSYSLFQHRRIHLTIYFLPSRKALCWKKLFYFLFSWNCDTEIQHELIMCGVGEWVVAMSIAGAGNTWPWSSFDLEGMWTGNWGSQEGSVFARLSFGSQNAWLHRDPISGQTAQERTTQICTTLDMHAAWLIDLFQSLDIDVARAGSVSQSWVKTGISGRHLHRFRKEQWPRPRKARALSGTVFAHQVWVAFLRLFLWI